MPHATSADGTRIRYHTTGSGPHVLLVHGSAGDANDWMLVRPHLGGFTLHLLERRGRGDSGDAPAYGLAREAEDVAAVAGSIGSPVAVVAHSYGALCALEAARLVPELTALVLYEPPFPPAPSDAEPLASALDARVAAGDHEGALSLFLQEAAGTPPEAIEEMARVLPPEAWAATVATAPTISRELRAAFGYALQPARFRDVTAPTLLLLGSESPPFFVDATLAVDAALPRSRIQRIPGTHGALLEAPEAVAAAVGGFVREHA